MSFVTLEDCEKALAAMCGAEVDGRSIKVEKARRNGGYQKTPGVCKFCFLATVLWKFTSMMARFIMY